MLDIDSWMKKNGEREVRVSRLEYGGLLIEGLTTLSAKTLNADELKQESIPHLTDQDKRDIIYFAKEKGDIKRWSGYEAKKKAIAKEFPEFLQALNKQARLDRELERVLEDIDRSIEE